MDSRLAVNSLLFCPTPKLAFTLWVSGLWRPGKAIGPFSPYWLRHWSCVMNCAKQTGRKKNNYLLQFETTEHHMNSYSLQYINETKMVGQLRSLAVHQIPKYCSWVFYRYTKLWNHAAQISPTLRQFFSDGNCTEWRKYKKKSAHKHK